MAEGTPNDSDISKAILTTEQTVKMTDLLSSGAAQTRLGNYEAAADNFEQVLIEYDCSNEEARRGLKATDPGNEQRYVKAIEKCK